MKNLFERTCNENVLTIPKWTDDRNLNIFLFMLMIITNKSGHRNVQFKYIVDRNDTIVKAFQLYSEKIIERALDVNAVYRSLKQNESNIQGFIDYIVPPI